MAATVCPPPAIENAFEFAIAFKISSVPFLYFSSSKTPIGPEMKIEAAFFISSLKIFMLSSPISFPSTKSTGSKILSLYFSHISFIFASISISIFPNIAKKAFAGIPPSIILSAIPFSNKFFITSIAFSYFPPPKMKRRGLSASFSSFSTISTSFCKSLPAKEGKTGIKPTKEQCFLCAAANASFTNASAYFESFSTISAFACSSMLFFSISSLHFLTLSSNKISPFFSPSISLIAFLPYTSSTNFISSPISFASSSACFSKLVKSHFPGLP